MIRGILFVLLILLGGLGLAQRFEVASIHATQPDKRQSIEVAPGNLAMRSVSLWASIGWAYGVRDYQLSGGPSWIKSDAFDIIARPDSAASRDQMRSMLQSLLADRFKLELHRESKEMPVYVINVGKNGPRLKPAKDETSPRGLAPAPGGITIESVSLQDLAEFLSGLPAFDRPVIDKTMLNGKFDMTLTLVDTTNSRPDEAKRAIATSDISNYMFALEQLGLKLEAQKSTIDRLVIDHAEKPVEN